MAGRYKIKRLLGQGGMGAVFEAFDPNLNKQVAIKVLLDPLREDQTRRFQMEATAAARLKHPNILSILDFGVTEDNLMFMVTEFVDGASLSSRLNKYGPLTADECTFVVAQVCTAMQHAHDAGVVHRDLKPANVMLAHNATDEASVKVLDFGIAKIVDREVYLTRTGIPLGSPAYMSPEQVTISGIDHRSDIYSLGCVIFECLEGDPPFEGESAIATMQMHLKENVPPLSRYKPDSALGASFNKLISKCTERDPGKRFQSMEQVREALAEIDTANGEEQSAKGDQKKQPSIHKNSSKAVNGKVILLSVMAIGVVVLLFFALTERIQEDQNAAALPTKLIDKEQTAFQAFDKTLNHSPSPTDNSNMALLASDHYDPGVKSGEFELIDRGSPTRQGNTWSLSNCKVSAQELRAFFSKNGSDLYKLELSRTILSKECFAELREHPIRELDLSEVTFPPGSLDMLSGVPLLHRLNIGIFASTEYRSLAKLKSLKELKIDGFLQSSRDYSFEPYKMPPNISLICLCNFQNGFSPGYIKELNNLKSFSELQIRSCNFNEGMSFSELLSGLNKKLQTFEVKNCEITSWPEAKNMTAKCVEISVPSNITAEKLAPFVRSLKVEILDLKNDRDDLRLERITPLFAMCPTLMILKANHLPMNRKNFQKQIYLAK